MTINYNKLISLYSIVFVLNYIIPFVNLIYAILIFLLIIISLKKYKFDIYHYIYLILGVYFFLINLIRGESDLGTLFFFISIPILLSVNKTLFNSKTSFRIISILFYSIIIIITFVAISKSSISLSTTRTITKAINYLLTASNDNIINVTDITNYILIGIPFVLHKKKKNLILIITLFASLFLSKSLAVEISLIYIILYNLNFKILKLISHFTVLIILLIPYFITLINQLELETLKILDILLNYRMTIWSEASIEIKKNLLIGLGETPLIVLTPYSETLSYSEFSFHSGYIRLLYQNGIIFYLGSILIFHKSINKITKNECWKNKNLLAFYIAFLCYLFTDGSIFTGYTYYILFLIPFIILNYRENEYTF